MDRDTIIRLAREAAFHTLVQYDELFRFAELIAKHECEECALIVDKANVSIDTTFTAVAAAIRSRNNGS